MTEVQAYISLKDEYDTPEAAEQAIENALGYPVDSYAAISRVTSEGSHGLTLESAEDEWFAADLQIVAYTLRVVTEYFEDEQYQNGTEFVDVPVEGTDAEGNTVIVTVKQEVPTYATREVIKERVTKERWAVSYVR